MPDRNRQQHSACAMRKLGEGRHPIDLQSTETGRRGKTYCCKIVGAKRTLLGACRVAAIDNRDVLGQRRADEFELEDGRVEAAEKVTAKVEHPFDPHTIRRHILCAVQKND